MTSRKDAPLDYLGALDRIGKHMGITFCSRDPQRIAIQIIAEFDAKQAEVDILKYALKTFADYAKYPGFGLNSFGNPEPDTRCVGWMYLTIGDFRRAALPQPPEVNE